MKDPFIFLCSEISRENALTLISWLRDEEVRRYLSETQNVTKEIRQLIDRVNLPVLTHLFNQNGRFYMAYNKQDRPVGFVRLIRNSAAVYEIVIVIGDRDNWNKKLGTAVIREAVKTAFFEFRAEKIIAKIHCENKRSIRAFVSSGFRPERETAQLKVYTLTIEQYLKRLKGEPYMSSEIYITKLDRDRIKAILDKLNEGSTRPDNNIKKLQGELSRAIVVEPQEVSRNVITMNSRAILQLDEQEMEVSLVYPEEADLAAMKLSVISPIGTAILGFKEGSSIKWEVPSGESMIHIKKVIYQPEAAGDYHL